MVNHQVLEGHWSELRGRIKEKWGQLNDDELMQVRGNVDQLIGLIQQKTGEARERIEQSLDELVQQHASVASRAAESLRGAAEDASVRLQQGYDQVSQSVRDQYAHAERTVQSKPIESVAIAFGTGLIAGVIVGLVVRSK